MDRTYNPILNRTEMTQRWFRSTVPAPELGTALVLVPTRGEPTVVWRGQRPPRVKAGTYRLYVVDVTSHPLSLVVSAASNEPAFPVEVTVEMACRVLDPQAIALHDIRDMTAELKPSLEPEIKEVMARFGALQPTEVARAIEEQLRSLSYQHTDVELSDYSITVDLGDRWREAAARLGFGPQELRLSRAARSLAENRNAPLPATDNSNVREVPQYLSSKRNTDAEVKLQALLSAVGGDLEDMHLVDVHGNALDYLLSGYGGSPAERIERFIEAALAQEFVVQIYLESDEGAAEVDQSVLDILAEMDADIGVRPSPVISSWFRIFKAKVKKVAESDPFSELALRLERAGEIIALHGPQAQIDSAEAGAAADLIRALADQKNALIQIGSLLLIKIDGNVIVRNLTQRELAYMQRNPSSAANAKEILNRLQGLSIENRLTAAIDEPDTTHQALELSTAHVAQAPFTGRIWTSREQRSLSVTNVGVIPVRNVWAVVEGGPDHNGVRVAEEDLPLSLLMPGQSAMLSIVGSGHLQPPVSVALRGEGPVGEAVECVIRIEV